MITLANLKEATAQQVFSQVALHLLTQGEKSIVGTGNSDDAEKCVYRSGSLKCAAGCLIGDDEYLPEMDSLALDGTGSDWICLTNRGLVPDSDYTNLITDLQTIHDTSEPVAWLSELQMFAEDHGLVMPAISEWMSVTS